MFSRKSEAAEDKQNVSGPLISTHISGKQHLSQPRGQHSVGFMDIMTPGEPKSGVFTRLYYPTDEQCLDEHERWPVWASEDKYISGIFTFMKSMVHYWPSWAPRSEFLFYNKVQHLIKLVPHSGFSRIFRYLFGHVYIPILENAKVKTDTNGGKWPVVVFSHGIGCSRSMYSQVCYDMASYGLIVAATEHREGSACMSRYYDFEDTTARTVNWIEHYQCQKDENEYNLRNHQVHLRSKEASRTLDLLLDLQDGKDVQNEYRKEDVVHSAVQPSSPNLIQFKGVMNVSQPIMSGHSFGGATTLLTLAEDTRFKAGIALDAWLFPIKDLNLSASVKQPILFINTESFLNTRNLEKMSTFSTTSSQNLEERKCLTIQGTVHQNHLDLPFLVQHKMLKRILGLYSDTCPEVVMNVNNKLMVQFIFKHLGLSADAEIDEVIAKNASLLKEGFGFSDKIPTTDW